MRKLTLAIIAAALALPASAYAAPCKDAKGKFTKCPPAAAAKSATVAKKEATVAKKEATVAKKEASVAKKETSVAKAAAAKPNRCRNAKGQFAKCGTPGAKPA